MSFESDLEKFVIHAEEMEQALWVNSLSAVHDSIQNGSPVTGSPGQPVGQYGPGYHEGEVGGTLKASWQVVPEAERRARVATNEVYAPENEFGIRRKDGGPYVQRSSVGGRHSVALTMAGWDKIVADETRKAKS
jgi:hypothetical protein